MIYEVFVSGTLFVDVAYFLSYFCIRRIEPDCIVLFLLLLILHRVVPFVETIFIVVKICVI